jgi:oxygen-dependent protoporphyrinogen oxidase
LERSDQQTPGWVVRGEGKEQWTADAVVLTCPAHKQAEILAELDEELARLIQGIAYNRVAVVALGYRQADIAMRVDGFGFLVPQRSRRDILGVQWCSSIFPERAPHGSVLLRAMCGGWNRPEIVGWDDETLLRAVRNELHVTMAISAEPVFHQIVRWERAIPQYQLGHLERVAKIEHRASHFPGLFLGGNAYRGVALNDCVEQAEVVAAQVCNFFTKSSFPSG